jgi:hypothetical protein
MSRSTSVGCDDEVAVAASVVGERRGAGAAVACVESREQKEMHAGELAAHDAAVRAELPDHGLVEALRV